MEEKKDQNIPGGLIYSKAFMPLSLDINVSMDFMQKKIPIEETVRVLYILKSEDALANKTANNADIRDISFFEDEREILLFSFSIYEISDIRKEDNYYVINLKIVEEYKGEQYFKEYVKEIFKEYNKEYFKNYAEEYFDDCFNDYYEKKCNQY